MQSSNINAGEKYKYFIILIVIGFIILTVFGIIAYHKLLKLASYKEFLQREFYKATGKNINFTEIFVNFPYITITNISIDENIKCNSTDTTITDTVTTHNSYANQNSLENHYIADKSKLSLKAFIEKIEFKPELWNLVFGKFVVDSLYISSSTVILCGSKLYNSSKSNDDQIYSIDKLDEKESNALEIINQVSEPKISNVTNKTLDEMLLPLFEASKIPVNYINIENLKVVYKSDDIPFEVNIALNDFSYNKIFNLSNAYTNVNLFDSIYSTVDLKATSNNVNFRIINKAINIENLQNNVISFYKTKYTNTQYITELIKDLELENLEASFNKIKDNASASFNFKATFKDNQSIFVTADISNDLPLSGIIKVLLNRVSATKLLQVLYKYNLAKIRIPHLQLNNNITIESDLKVKDNKIDSVTTKIIHDNLRLVYSNISFSLDKNDENPLIIKYIPLQNVVTWSNSEINIDKSKFRISGQLNLQKGVHLQAGIEAKVDLESTYKSFIEYLPSQYHHIKPKGYSHFGGDLIYDNDGVKINGKLEFSNVVLDGLKELGHVKIDYCNIRLNNFGTKEGKISIATFVADIGKDNLCVQCFGDITGFGSLQFDIIYKITGKIDVIHHILSQYFAESLPYIENIKAKGNAIVKGSFKGPISNPKLQYSFDISDTSLLSNEYSINLTNLSAKGSGDTNNINITSLNAKLNNSDLSLSGQVRNFISPTIQSRIDISSVDLDNILNIISKSFKTLPKELKVDGLANLNINANGELKNLKINGRAQLKNVNFYHPAILRALKNILAEIEFDNKGIVANQLKANWGSSTVNLSGKISDWSVFNLDFLYNINPLDITDVGNFFLKESAFSIKSKGVAEGRVVGPINKFILTGFAKLSSGEFLASTKKGGECYKFPFSELQSLVKYSDGNLELESFKTKLFNGYVTATGSIMLLSFPISFTFYANGQKLSVEDFLAVNSKYKDTIYGKVDVQFYGKGNTDGLNTIHGFWSFKLSNGRYYAPPLLAKLFHLLDLEKITQGSINDFIGNFDIIAGYMNSKETLAKSELGSLGFIGKIGLDTSIKGTLDIILTSAASEYSNTIKQLLGTNKAISFPAQIDGTLFNPQINLKLDKIIAKTIKEEAKRAVKDILNPAINVSPASSSQNASPTNKVDKILQKIEEEIDKSKQKIEKKLKDFGKKIKLKL